MALRQHAHKMVFSLVGWLGLMVMKTTAARQHIHSQCHIAQTKPRSLQTMWVVAQHKGQECVVIENCTNRACVVSHNKHAKGDDCAIGGIIGHVTQETTIKSRTATTLGVVKISAHWPSVVGFCWFSGTRSNSQHQELCKPKHMCLVPVDTELRHR